MTYGRIHSIESMGLVDGPGVRSVVFFQGCRLRCQYCHNPDTWSLTGKDAQHISAEALVKKLSRFKPYYGDRGGVTFSGGEPLLQKDFLLEALIRCKQAGIHTCLDIKHYTEEGYRKVTGMDFEASRRFLETVQQMKVPMWIRHVVVPGLTDGETHLEGLKTYIQSLKNVERVELLPYHVLGVHKYKALGIPYPLEGVEPMNPELLSDWQIRMNTI